MVEYRKGAETSTSCGREVDPWGKVGANGREAADGMFHWVTSGMEINLCAVDERSPPGRTSGGLGKVPLVLVGVTKLT